MSNICHVRLWECNFLLLLFLSFMTANEEWLMESPYWGRDLPLLSIAVFDLTLFSWGLDMKKSGEMAPFCMITVRIKVSKIWNCISSAVESAAPLRQCSPDLMSLILIWTWSKCGLDVKNTVKWPIVLYFHKLKFLGGKCYGNNTQRSG